jgi:hypothetical protein
MSLPAVIDWRDRWAWLFRCKVTQAVSFDEHHDQYQRRDQHGVAAHQPQA